MDGEMIGRGETDPWQKKKENTNEIKTGTNIHLFHVDGNVKALRGTNQEKIETNCHKLMKGMSSLTQKDVTLPMQINKKRPKT